MKMTRNVRARFTNGAIVPLEPLDIEEGKEIVVTLEEEAPGSEEAEDAALTRAIEKGLKGKRVGVEEVKKILREWDEAENAPSPEGAIEALRASAGGWVGMHDPEELKRMIYEARITGSREEPRL